MNYEGKERFFVWRKKCRSSFSCQAISNLSYTQLTLGFPLSTFRNDPRLIICETYSLREVLIYLKMQMLSALKCFSRVGKESNQSSRAIKNNFNV